ncbi:NADPH-dependent 2,4-dienoyl-CoA reductase/sulfur reductase-like enzyme [Rhodoglobus vestalii]|uniref:NADPH-dependent 2,4-dienoyl-CoA reductase/sulfur reductase-like enzyme n=1 Tax=Rhodoglobus vestalii TaxID=193384 RepID=A0A8H2K6F6_9MICO|nr:FAD-dependent oxidoreductase [Rhodoglobus vestalii]TQO20045.1 NADPH-dependent 2,4-dienoyl-CoA reductase/sulfur reductase-like enzyme [Rhodoglobus vestalii]
MDRVVIVGGSLAGVNAAEALREHGFEGDLTLISAEESLPYDRPPLSKQMLLTDMAPEQLLLKESDWYEKNGLDVVLGNPARGLDPIAQRVALSDGTEREYDGLVLATGSAVRELSVVHGEPRLHVLHSMDDAIRLRAEFAPGKHLVLVGGGFIGLEVAAAARWQGLDVTVIARGPAPLSRVFVGDIGRWYQGLHERNGVNVRCGSALEAIEWGINGAVVTLTNGSVINADIVVAGVGSTPAVEWLANSGVEITNGLACTPDLMTSVPNVVAAGDIVSWRNPIFDEEMRVEHWTNAIDQGRHAAATLLGNRDPFASVPYFWTDQFDTKMRFVGRTTGADHTNIETLSDDKLVATFGRDGVVIGAVCIGAPRQLAKYKVAIQNRTPWDEAVEASLIAAR